ncbi:hypothetical protein Nizo1840_0041 [Lactiplantibacillus plantarum]|nr:hypothetical protein Nizo1840_0041 [Lactiplantibacillus plantarum]
MKQRKMNVRCLILTFILIQNGWGVGTLKGAVPSQYKK